MIKNMSLEKEFEKKGMSLKEWLKENADNGMSRPEMAIMLDCSVTTIRFYSEKYKIKFKPKKSNWCRNLFKDKA